MLTLSFHLSRVVLYSPFSVPRTLYHTTRQINIVLLSLSSRTLFSLLSSPTISTIQQDRSTLSFYLSQVVLYSSFSVPLTLYHTIRQINIVLLSLLSRTLFSLLSSPHSTPYNKTDQHCPFISLKSY